MSICPRCNEESKFRPTTAAKNPIWFTCENCGEKVTKIENHRYSLLIPADGIIIPFDSDSEYVDEPDESYFEPGEEEEEFDVTLETQLATALAIAEKEKLAEKEEERKEEKRPLLEKEKMMRKLDYDPEEDEDEEYDEEELDIYESSFTDELADLLRDYQIKKPAAQTILKQSSRLEENNEFMHPNELREKLIAIAKVTDKVAAIITRDYQKLLDSFEEEESQPSFEYDRRRSYARPNRREPEQKEVGLVLQELQFERQLNDLQRELDKRDNKIERLEDKNQDLARELMQSQQQIRQLEQINAQLNVEIARTSTDVKVKDIEMKYAKNYSDDSMKLTSELIDKASDIIKETRPLSQLGNLTGRRMPTDSRIQVSKEQDERTKEFEALTKSTTETSKVLLGQQLNIEDLIVNEDEEYEE